MDVSFLKPVDTWFWVFSISVLIAILATYLSIRNHAELRWLLILRGISLIIALFLLLQPRFKWTETNTIELDWNFYVDNSVSIGYHPALSLQTIKSELSQLVFNLNKQDVSPYLYSFSESVSALENVQSWDGKGSSTNLGSVISHIVSDQEKLAGATIITDGQINQGLDPSKLIQKVEVPVYTLGIGHSTPLVDLSIQSIDAPTVAIKGEDLRITVTINSTGDMQERVNVILYQGKKMLGSRYLQTKGFGSRAQARFMFAPSNLGENEYRVKVSTVSQEINIENNQQKFFVTILKDRYKVALITGSPSFNTSVIKRYIRKYPRVELDHFVRRKNGYLPALKSFWSRPYQLIIFDNYPLKELSSKTQRIYSKKIGAEKSSLLWLLGGSVTEKSASSIIPFFHLRMKDQIQTGEKTLWYMTPEALSRSIFQGLELNDGLDFWQNFPPILASYNFESTNDEIEAIAYNQGSDIVPLMFLGEKQGIRSAVWASPEFSTIHHRLSGTNYSKIFPELWTRLFSWLLKTSGDKNLYFRLNKESYQQGEEILITGTSIGNKNGSKNQAFITTQNDSLEINSAELRFNPESKRWEGNIWAPKPGKYSYEISIQDGSAPPVKQNGRFIVEESQIELNEVALNSPLLENLSMKTNGAYYPWASRAELFNKVLPRERQEKINRSTRFNEESWVLVTLIVLLTIEWVIRKRIGLP
ncbi:MAG: hypothetical protein VX284_06165 [Candidatus Neomarinimicrobiota bacterium]|nr:hypothetical protein [Candidatus Neomarinimicrobiota bacterium]